jgi:rhodanese-related sulfurtransferase
MKKLLIDVREKVEFERDNIEGSLNIPLSSLVTGKANIDQLPKDSELVLYCRSGHRSALAMKFLKNKGYEKMTNGGSLSKVRKNLK